MLVLSDARFSISISAKRHGRLHDIGAAIGKAAADAGRFEAAAD
jgi:hypothetical protein